jgi:DNA repair protein RecO (recombination protein O)
MHALVLSREPRQEYDERLCFLSENDEVVETVARGSKKNTSKNSFHLEPGTHIEVEIVQGKEQRYVGSVVPLGDAIFLPASFEGLHALMYLAALLTDVLEERVQYQGLYRGVMRWREQLQVTIGDSVLLHISVLLALVLRSLGYEPVVDRCAHCAKAIIPPYLFSYQQGGLVCTDCRDRLNVGVDHTETLTVPQFEILQEVCGGRVKKINSDVRDEESVHALLYKFLEFHLERQVPKFTPFHI